MKLTTHLDIGLRSSRTDDTHPLPKCLPDTHRNITFSFTGNVVTANHVLKITYSVAGSKMKDVAAWSGISHGDRRYGATANRLLIG